MRRWVGLWFLVIVLVMVSACAHMGQAPAGSPPVIARILQRGEAAVGTAASMPPLNMTTKDGEIIGLEVDLANRIARGMGVKLRLVPMPFSELLPSLEAGKVDMVLSQMTILPERNLRVAFVRPYLISDKSLLTKTTLLSLKNPKGL